MLKRQSTLGISQQKNFPEILDKNAVNDIYRGIIDTIREESYGSEISEH
jgi:hypothetical protein